MMIVVEGDTDLPYVRKLVEDGGLSPTSSIDAGGKDNIDRELGKYVSIGHSMPVVVVRDLDHDASCAPLLLRGMGLRQSRWMRFRLAVRELESWILADVSGLSRFLGVDARWFPTEPDDEGDPTSALLKIAARAPESTRRKLLPKKGSAAVVGPLYEATLIEFGECAWSVVRASKRSPSLPRARSAIKALAADWKAFVDP